MARVASKPVGKIKIVDVPVGELKLWKDNPRKNDAAAKKLAKIIAKHGFNSPLVCSPDNIIRAGNTRYKAALILGLETVPVVYVNFPTEKMAEMYSIADNKSHEFAEWDPLGLAKILGENTVIPLAEMEELTGISQPEILDLRRAGVMSPDSIGDDQLPQTLEAMDIVGEDLTLGRFIIVYNDDDEKATIAKLLGIDGSKIIWRVDELSGGVKKKKVSSRVVS